MQERGLYIHIPFCKKRCFYCDFVSNENKDELIENYIQAVIKELQLILCKDNYYISTVYIGGGTPSYIESKYINKILEQITKRENNIKEITIEVNPGTVNKIKLMNYKNADVNRLSIGLQTTNNNLLKIIGRIHTFEQFKDTYNLAREVGFNNINVDLMLGLPSQTIQDIKNSVETITELNPEHISIYSLILEPNTKLYDIISNGSLKLPQEDVERQMYWYAKNMLELQGYNHYEISNFAKNGYESKHNLNCWKQKEYFGVGVASSSYIDGIRYSNISDVLKYISNIESNNLEENKIIEEVQTDESMKKEYMLLGLRTTEGVSIQEFKKKFNINPIYYFKDILNKLVSQKLIIIDGDFIKLSPKGLDFGNRVWIEFV